MNRQRNPKVFRMVLDSLLASLALIIFVIELQLPSLTPIPGIKLGLSNIVTLVVMFICGPIDALFVLLIRVFLGCIFSGQIMALAYSLAGGILSYILLWVLRKAVTENQIFVCSVFCAVAHNAGQIFIAFFLTKTAAIFYYLPILCVSGIIAGIFTGFCAQFTVKHMKKLFIYYQFL